jgi:hypothetical protein
MKSKDLGNCWTNKTKSLRFYVECNEKFQIRGENVEEVEKFTYLDSKITRDGGNEIDVKTYIQKANSAFMLTN